VKNALGWMIAHACLVGYLAKRASSVHTVNAANGWLAMGMAALAEGSQGSRVPRKQVLRFFVSLILLLLLPPSVCAQRSKRVLALTQQPTRDVSTHAHCSPHLHVCGGHAGRDVCEHQAGQWPQPRCPTLTAGRASEGRARQHLERPCGSCL